jgi:hypothetical protein
MVDISPWIGSVTALAGMAKSWLEVRKATVDLAKARETLESRVEPAPTSTSVTGRPPDEQAIEVVIDPNMLDAFLLDVRNAANRFTNAINDPRYSPADIEREQERAQLTVRTHIARIKEFNAGILPTDELRKIAASFRCDA